MERTRLAAAFGRHTSVLSRGYRNYYDTFHFASGQWKVMGVEDQSMILELIASEIKSWIMSGYTVRLSI
jgi:hypothetical protein